MDIISKPFFLPPTTVKVHVQKKYYKISYICPKWQD